MENPADDPREFARGDPGDFEVPPGLDAFLGMLQPPHIPRVLTLRLVALQSLSDRGNPSRSRRRPESDGVRHCSLFHKKFVLIWQHG